MTPMAQSNSKKKPELHFGGRKSSLNVKSITSPKTVSSLKSVQNFGDLDGKPPKEPVCMAIETVKGFRSEVASTDCK